MGCAYCMYTVHLKCLTSCNSSLWLGKGAVRVPTVVHTVPAGRNPPSGMLDPHLVHNTWFVLHACAYARTRGPFGVLVTRSSEVNAQHEVAIPVRGGPCWAHAYAYAAMRLQ
jgi:hypothetical protein